MYNAEVARQGKIETTFTYDLLVNNNLSKIKIFRNILNQIEK